MKRNNWNFFLTASFSFCIWYWKLSEVLTDNVGEFLLKYFQTKSCDMVLIVMNTYARHHKHKGRICWAFIAFIHVSDTMTEQKIFLHTKAVRKHEDLCLNPENSCKQSIAAYVCNTT